MAKLRPFFHYYGGKWRAADRYPSPSHDTIEEPFAGSAGYSTRHPDRRVVLTDANPVIVSVWEYLTGVREGEFRGLPMVHSGETVDDLPIPQEARWLIGFWLTGAATSPNRSPGAWMRSGVRPGAFWGEKVRDLLAGQLSSIRHWKVRHGSFESVGNHRATWFVDPPYNNKAGKHYKHQVMDYHALGEWCRSREGQVIVCEQAGATWLPFSSIGKVKSNPSKRGGGHSEEAAWIRSDDEELRPPPVTA